MTPKGRTNLGYVLIAVGFGMFLAGLFIVLAAGLEGITIALPSILGFVVMVAGGMALSVASGNPQRPPTVGGGATLECPNCGAGAKAVDADVFATCAYCGTRFAPVGVSP